MTMLWVAHQMPAYLTRCILGLDIAYGQI